MLALRYNETVVRRVRLKCHQLDPLAAQLRLENVLQTVELHPAWLSPSAIVCVRRLHNPHTLDLQDHTASQATAWRHALAAAMEEKIKRAARPASGEYESDAVIFQDRAELLACLASDLCEGLVESRWWWRTLFKHGNFGNRIFSTWSNSPEYVPAALELLARKGQLGIFVRTLSVDDTRELLRVFTISFALPALQSALDQGLEPQTGITSDISPLTAPWHLFAPEALDHTFAVEQQCLIGVALAIRRAPAAVRSPQFATATLRWLRAVVAENVNLPSQSTKSQLGHGPSQSTESQPGHGPSQSTESQLGHGQYRNAVASGQRGSTRTQENRMREADPTLPRYGTDRVQVQPLVSEAKSLPESFPLSREIGAPLTKVTEELSALTARHTSTDDLPLDEIEIQTELGGVFYLINVGLFLGLYGDFTTPAEPGLTLPIFDFVTLTAQRLLSAHAECVEFNDDPGWALLAQLAGRSESDPPGLGFEPPDQWNSLDQWLDWLVPYIHARLIRALGVDEVVQLLCVHRATVRATAVHLDISFPLAEHPLELRCAGLDRDPGWVPAAGRFIRFHYQ